jgi:hypothetical protein
MLRRSQQLQRLLDNTLCPTMWLESPTLFLSFPEQSVEQGCQQLSGNLWVWLTFSSFPEPPAAFHVSCGGCPLKQITHFCADCVCIDVGQMSLSVPSGCVWGRSRVGGSSGGGIWLLLPVCLSHWPCPPPHLLTSLQAAGCCRGSSPRALWTWAELPLSRLSPAISRRCSGGEDI